MSKANVIKTRKIASPTCRIHVERAIGHIKQYHIILTSAIPLNIPHVDSIWFNVCGLTLFHPPLVDADKLSDADLPRIKLSCLLDSELNSLLHCCFVYLFCYIIITDC